MRFVIDDAVLGTVDHRVYAQGEDMLMVRCKNTGVDNCAPRNAEAFVDRLSGEDASCTDFVHDLASLVENEGKDIFIVRDGDDRL